MWKTREKPVIQGFSSVENFFKKSSQFLHFPQPIFFHKSISTFQNSFVEKLIGIDIGTDISYLGRHGGIRFQHVFYFTDRGKHGGVISVFELFSDLHQG